jgi:malto-oligosyltrehalose trehalohydrolase
MSVNPDRRAHSMPFGAQLRPDGSVLFRLWAPSQHRVSLVLGDSDLLPMTPLADGWHEFATERASAGTLYRFELEDGIRVPDPASRYQPHDVHGPSQVVDPRAYQWSDTDWRGRPWHEAVIYELHVGVFTPEGSFRAAIGKLEHLVMLGVTAIELMPIADFAGQRNWGYDGVLLFAPDASYGSPDDLKALVDAAHARGLMVILDVVYNHFGPEGNYLNAYARQFFTERHKTPWGPAINYDGPDSRPVRDFMIHNALYWLEEYHFDGLRLDAVHAIIDDSPTHILAELGARVRAEFVDQRHIHLVLENEENEAHWLERAPGAEPLTFTAQWNDDAHHVLHTAATGENAGYYMDYRRDPEKLARALAEGFAFQGQMMEYRGEPRGEPCRHLPPTAFVSFIQNHDQVGNRAFGDRLTAIAPPEAVRAIAAIHLLAPQIPMLFMGEEWAAAQPFPFFCDFGAELGEAVRNGRREEFAKFPEFQDEGARERIPDPISENTFRSAQLAWDDQSRQPHAGWLDWYRRVLDVRHREVVPRLPDIAAAGEYEVLGEGAVRINWRLGEAGRLSLLANLSETSLNTEVPAGRTLWREGETKPDGLGPWSVIWTIDCGGSRDDHA